MNSVSIFCGSSSGNNPVYEKEAFSLGEILADRKIRLVYGGAKVGLMGSVAQGALSKGGTVIGIIPSFLKTKEVVHDHLSDLITVETMHERKSKMNELSEGIIALPGGFGTMEEFFEILTWGQLGLHEKPMGLLNTNGFYSPLMQLFNQMVASGFLKKVNFDMVLVSEQIDGLLKKMTTYEAPEVEKWISIDKT